MANKQRRASGFLTYLGVVAFIAIAAVVSGTRVAHACSCDADPADLTSLLGSNDTTAFVGKATAVSAPQNGEVTYTFTVERSLRGYGGPTVSVKTFESGAQCGVTFPLNVTLGVALKGSNKDAFSAFLCGGYISTTNTGAFETWVSGSLPAPTGSGPVAGFGEVGPNMWAVFDAQARVLGYIPELLDGSLSSCPGSKYLFGTYQASRSADGSTSLGAVRVDLSTLAVTRYTYSELTYVECLDAEGTLLLLGEDPDSNEYFAYARTVSVGGVRHTIPGASNYTYYFGLTSSAKNLIWLTSTDVVVTSLDGVVQRRTPYTPSPYNAFGPPVDIRDDFLVQEAADRASFKVIDVVTGATTPSIAGSSLDWTYSQRRLYRLSSPTTLDVIDLPSGALSQLPITNGPADKGWTLEVASSDPLLLVRIAEESTAAKPTSFYSISSSGAATAYPVTAIPQALNSSDSYYLYPWSANTYSFTDYEGGAWLITPTGSERVLNGYFMGSMERIQNGPSLAPNACGRTSVPTSNYTCSLSPPLDRLPDLL